MNSNHARTILHIDLDCFYCQVEQKRLGISPNVPVAVQQWEGLIAINYAARAAGITRHMRVHEAKALCPELQCVHVETIGGNELDTKDRTKQKACLERYRKACLQILAVLHKTAPQAVIEKASIDEVYMDVTTMVEKELKERAQADCCREPEGMEGGARDWEAGGSPVDAFSWGSIVLGGGPLDVGSEFERRLSIGANIACRLRGAIREQLGFTCSAGIAANKLLAKVASALKKPNQQTIVPPRAVDGLMADLPLKKLRNFGGKLGAELGAMGCTTAGQVAALPHGQLTARFGEERATSIARAVRGYSDEPVQVKELPKSMLAAKSFNATSAPAELDRWMRILAEELSHRLTEDGLAHSRAPRTLSLSYRGSNGDRSKCGPAPRPTKEGITVDALVEAGSLLLRKCPDICPCARLALQASDFYSLPLSDDQGAISRFLTGATPGDGGASAGEASKPRKSGPQQPSIAQMFKRAAARSSAPGPPPPDHASGAAAVSAQQTVQEALPALPAQPDSARSATEAASNIRAVHGFVRSPGQLEGAAEGRLLASGSGQGNHVPSTAEPRHGGSTEGEAARLLIPSDRRSSERAASQPSAVNWKVPLQAEPAEAREHSSQQPPPTVHHPSSAAAASGCAGSGSADRSSHGMTARHAELREGGGACSKAHANGSVPSQHPFTTDLGGAVASGAPQSSMAADPCQPPSGSDSAAAQNQADTGNAGVAAHPECDLGSVDVEEQKRIMREIWLRGQGNASKTGEGDVRGEAAPSPASDRSGKRERGVAGSGAGVASKEGASKQMRISAMFKAPKKA